MLEPCSAGLLRCPEPGVTGMTLLATRAQGVPPRREAIRTRIVPHAVRWYTGEANEDDDDDDDEDEEGEDEDHYDEDEDEVSGEPVEAGAPCRAAPDSRGTTARGDGGGGGCGGSQAEDHGRVWLSTYAVWCGSMTV